MNTCLTSLGELIDQLSTQSQALFGKSELPSLVVSPYRFNPLGAHIDHQGGTVLARTLNQYSVGAYYGSGDNSMRFKEWAATQGINAEGVHLVVHGTLIGAGLSSSASIILAYLTALAGVNHLTLSAATLVELCRQVENQHMGLNNGVQDQMSVVFGQRNALSSLNVDNTSVEYWNDPTNIDEVCWLVCYSGFSRELISSGFNERVGECQLAAQQLHPGSTRLGDVPGSARNNISALPEPLMRRARHVYSEMQRVADAKSVWQSGDWPAFGALMNSSCLSSIEDYQCGSEPMHYLHRLASNTYGVYGSRFSGGGYGGCLIMLADASCVDKIADTVLSGFIDRYPEQAKVATTFVAQPEAAVRTL